MYPLFVTLSIKYRIHSIRCRGYYLFHRPICAAPIWEQHLLISVNLSLVPRPLPCFQCTLDTADEAEKSDPFTDIEENDDELEDELVLDDRMLNCIHMYCYHEPRKPHPVYSIGIESQDPLNLGDVHTCYSKPSRGYYSRVATISFNASGGVASIRERQLIEWCLIERIRLENDIVHTHTQYMT